MFVRGQVPSVLNLSLYNLSLSRTIGQSLMSSPVLHVGPPDRVSIPCLMHDSRLCQLDVRMTND